MPIKFKSPNAQEQDSPLIIKKVIWGTENGSKRIGKIFYVERTGTIKEFFVLKYPINGNNVQHGTYEGPSEFTFGSEPVRCRIVPDEGEEYAYPLTVTATGARVTNYNPETGEFLLGGPTPGATEIIINAACTSLLYNVAVDAEHITCTGAAPFSRSLTLTLDTSLYPGYLVPESLSASNVSGCDYVYTVSASGYEATLILSNPVTDVQITVSGVEGYRIYTSGSSNCSFTGYLTAPSGVVRTLTVTADDSYECPSEITVNGVTGTSGNVLDSGVTWHYTANGATGTIVFENAVRNITVRVNALSTITLEAPTVAVDENNLLIFANDNETTRFQVYGGASGNILLGTVSRV